MTSVLPLRRAVFLDRDGTLNIEKDYLHRPEDFEFIAGAPEAVKLLKDAGFMVIVVTNQSGVARGYFDLAAVQTLHGHMQTLLAAFDTAIDAFYVCPHHPQFGQEQYRTECDCRKGKPGMLLAAAREHGIDLHGSYMIGDKAGDIEAGARAGCCSILVSTGYGIRQADAARQWDHLRADDLLSAVRLILRRSSQSTC